MYVHFDIHHLYLNKTVLKKKIERKTFSRGHVTGHHISGNKSSCLLALGPLNFLSSLILSANLGTNKVCGLHG